VFEEEKKVWDPFRLITEAEYYDNLERIRTFSKTVFSGLAKIKGNKKLDKASRAA
jgi:hypothetical protein